LRQLCQTWYRLYFTLRRNYFDIFLFNDFCLFTALFFNEEQVGFGILLDLLLLSLWWVSRIYLHLHLLMLLIYSNLAHRRALKFLLRHCLMNWISGLWQAVLVIDVTKPYVLIHNFSAMFFKSVRFKSIHRKLYFVTEPTRKSILHFFYMTKKSIKTLKLFLAVRAFMSGKEYFCFFTIYRPMD